MEEFQKTKMWKIADYQKPKAKCRSYSPTQMKTAYHLCRDTGAPIRTTARQYGVPEATLRHKLSGRINPEAVRSGPPPLFTQEEEAKLVEHLKFNASLGHGYSRKEVIDIATEYAVALGYRKPGGSLSLGWFVLLKSRWPELKIFQGPKNPRAEKRMATNTEQDSESSPIMAKKKKLKQGHTDSTPSQTTSGEGVNKTVGASIHNTDNNTGSGGSGSVSDNTVSGYVIQEKSLISGNEKLTTKPLNHNFVKQKGASGNQRIVDRKLIPRIQEYLDGKPNKKNVSIPAISQYLQNRYQEYSRRKYGVFAKYVEKAYSMMDHESDSDDSSLDSESDEAESENGTGLSQKKRRKVLNEGDDSDELDKDEGLVEYKDTNAINNMMANMYKNSPRNTTDKPQREPSLNLNSGNKQRVNDNGESNNLCYIDRQGSSKSAYKLKHLTHKSAKTTNKKKQTDLRKETTVRNVNDHEDQVDQIVIDSDIEEVVDDQIDPQDEGMINSNDQMDDSIMDEIEKSVSKRAKKLKMKVQKKKKDGDQSTKGIVKEGPSPLKSDVTFVDIGGNEQNLVEICKLLVHMRHPEVYNQLGVTPPRGFLLHGPPGCGKTLLANAIAGELDLPMIKIAATEIVSGVSGDSEEKVRDLFEKATQAAPCVLFIDEVDAITPKREIASKDMERRIVSQLLTCLDDLNKNKEAHVLVIGATNRPDSLDPALRRAGRFDKEISLGIPDEQSRKRILEVLCRNLRLTPGFDFSYLAKFTPGYVGADLMSLTREAAMVAVNRVFKDLQTSSNICDKRSTQTPTNQDCSQTETVMDTAEIVSSDRLTETNGNNACLTDSDRTDGICVTNNTHCSENVSPNCASSSIGVSDLTSSNTSNSNRGISNIDVSTSHSDVVISQADSEVGVMETGDSINSVCTADRLQDTDNVVCSGDFTWQSAETREERVPIISEDPHVKELQSVLSWLKDQPPLTENQLRDLFVTLEDFKIALKSVQPSAKREGFATVPDVTWDDIGALHHVREELQLAILAPVRHPEEFKALGLNKAQGILLAGPPGCGKTLLAKAVANESGINFISVKGPELLNMYVGESEKAVRTVFQRARNSSPCVIFFDELDALCPRRSGSAEGGSSTRVVNQLLTEMDGLEERKQVFIMAATNRPDIIDPAVLRPGRLDKTLYVGLPTLPDRIDILRCLTKNGTQPILASDVDMNNVAGDQRCENYTGADLAALVREASISALKEAIAQPGRPAGQTIQVNPAHFETAFRKIKPSVSDMDRERYINMGSRLAIDV